MNLRRLHVFAVGTGITDVRIRQGYDLPAVGWIRQDLLVTSHRSIENDFADSFTVGADRCAVEYGSVLQCQNSRFTQKSDPQSVANPRSLAGVGLRCKKAEGHGLPLVVSLTAQRSGVVY